MSSDECGQYFFEDFEDLPRFEDDLEQWELNEIMHDDAVSEIEIGVEDSIELEEN